MHVRTYQIFARTLSQKMVRKQKRQIMQSRREFAGRNFCIPNCSISHCKRSLEAGKRITLFYTAQKTTTGFDYICDQIITSWKKRDKAFKACFGHHTALVMVFKARVDPSSTVLSHTNLCIFPSGTTRTSEGKDIFSLSWHIILHFHRELGLSSIVC